MAEEYFDPDIVIDSEELTDDQFAYMEGAFPGWRPAPGNVDTWLLEAGGRLGSEVATLALMVPSPAIMRVFGERIARLLPIDATSATAISTWTLGDSSGHTVEAGTVVSIQNIAFEVVSDVIVASGQTVANNVSLIAVTEGSAGSGLSGPAVLEDSTGYTASIVLAAPTSGGQDGETNEQYMDRLAREQELSAPRPLNARDVELFSRRVIGVDRVLVLEYYRPGPPISVLPFATNIPLTFTVVPVDEAGLEVTVGVAAQLLATLQVARGTNWQIYIMPPSYTIIDVHFDVICHREFDPASVRLQVIDAVTNFLSPANFAQPTFGENRRWTPTPAVYHRELAAAIDRVEGVDRIPTLQFAIQGNALTENVDVALPNTHTLTQPGTITGTAVLP